MLDKNWLIIGLCFILPWPWTWPVGLYLLIKKLRKRNKDGDFSFRKMISSGLIFATAGLVLIINTNGDFQIGNWQFVAGALVSLYGAGLAVYSAIAHKRERFFAKYQAIIRGRKAVAIAEVASAMPVSFQRACRDLQIMIDKGEFEPGAYLDMGARVLVFDRAAIIEVVPEPEIPLKAMKVEEEAGGASAYRERIEEIRALNRTIEDDAVSREIDQIEALTASIFRAVEDNPGKKPQIHKFMSYYLPTTLKLLRQYSHLERQSLGGENVNKSKQDIEKVLDKIVQGFESQLDQLYRADAMDISADIVVLETMMAKDGLTQNEYVFVREERKQS